MRKDWVLYIVLALGLSFCGDDPAFRDVERPRTVDPVDRAEDLPGNRGESRDQETLHPSDDVIDGDRIVDEVEDEEDSDDSEDSDEENRPEPEVVTLNFVQNLPAEVDILWVIDNSGSMGPLQASLRSNIQSFISEMADSDLDFQIGITSTDVCHDRMPSALAERRCPKREAQSSPHHRGSLVGDEGRRVLRRGDGDLVSRFQRYADLGTRGSSFEHGLTAAKLAVEKSLEGRNEGFIRRDAFLSIIVVSDERDDGVGLAEVDEEGVNYWAEDQTRYSFRVKDLENYLASVKGKGMFSMASIVGTKDEAGELCRYQDYQVYEEGTEYLQMSRDTKGLAVSICDGAWSAKLQKIADHLDNQIESFELPSIPMVDSIEVKVDGIATKDWRYLSDRNAIRFKRGHLPEPGSEITVRYSKCLTSLASGHKFRPRRRSQRR